jgi:hypothetical protein
VGKVVADMSVSLDGFVAGPHDEMDHVFAWYGRNVAEDEQEVDIGKTREVASSVVRMTALIR